MAWGYRSHKPCRIASSFFARDALGMLRTPQGEVTEWLKVLVLKTSEPKGSVGSNPTLTATNYT